jgi:hypothetical protein
MTSFSLRERKQAQKKLIAAIAGLGEFSESSITHTVEFFLKNG